MRQDLRDQMTRFACPGLIMWLKHMVNYSTFTVAEKVFRVDLTE